MNRIFNKSFHPDSMICMLEYLLNTGAICIYLFYNFLNIKKMLMFENENDKDGKKIFGNLKVGERRWQCLNTTLAKNTVC